MRSWFRPATAVGSNWIDPSLRMTPSTASGPPASDRAGVRKCRATRKRRAASAETFTFGDTSPAMKIVPANKASWEDLEAVLGGAACHGGRCYCQRFKLRGNLWPGEALDHAHMLREQTDCG